MAMKCSIECQVRRVWLGTGLGTLLTIYSNQDTFGDLPGKVCGPHRHPKQVTAALRHLVLRLFIVERIIFGWGDVRGNRGRKILPGVS